jgi:hypothetical protein
VRKLVEEVFEAEVEDYAALIRATAQWRGITVTAFERKQWEAIRQEVAAAHGQRHASPVTRSRARRRPGAEGER